MTTPSAAGKNQVYYVVGSQGSSQAGSRTNPSQASSSGSRTTQTQTQTQTKTTTQSNNAKVPSQLPQFLGNRQIIFYSWIGAMILVGFDEWHNYHILPRPARLWYTSLTYGLLTLVSLSDAIVPLANALAIGYVVMLLWQYYNGSGQFAQGS